MGKKKKYSFQGTENRLNQRKSKPMMSLKRPTMKFKTKKKSYNVKKPAMHEISGKNIIDFGVEEMKTWGTETKDTGSTSNREFGPKRRAKSENAVPYKKSKLDRAEEQKVKEYEVKEQFKDSIQEFREKGLPDMESWKILYVPKPVLLALAEDGFVTPTPIQMLALPSATRDRMDIIGAAETGSGKTLAFGIPLIHHILRLKEETKHKKDAGDNSDDAESGIEDESESGSNADESDDDSDASDVSDKEKKESSDDELNIDEDSLSDDTGDKTVLSSQQVSRSLVEELEIPYGVDFSVFDDPKAKSGDEGEGFDLSPGEESEEELPELQDDEMGCVRAVNNVEFDWLEKPKKLKAASQKQAPLYALVLCPTRELAIQVKNHLERAARHTGIKIATVVGGMSAQKQERILKKCPEIVVATPGRLWELIQQGQTHLNKVEFIKYLVIDEADRMVEKGHFQELSTLLELINSDESRKKARQTFVFSATLTLVHSGPDRKIFKKKKKYKKMTEKEKLDSLMLEVGLKDRPKVIDLSRKQGTAETLVESRIGCDKTEKDVYLYYFTQQYPGRTLVFANSKDCIRRLVTVFTLLQCNPLPLHADMHQKQRLKNLDRFKANRNGLLLATDVAARGLDIPDVQHVIHYQVPRTSENYVHRSGRTARASKEGLSVMLVSPDDLKNYRNIIKTLNRDNELPVFPVEQEYLPGLKARVRLAVKIDKDEHVQIRQKKQNSWFEKAAKEMDIELDEDQLLNDLGDSHQQAVQKQKFKQMKLELSQLLKEPVISRQFSGKYPTKSGKLIMPYIPDKDTNAVKKLRLQAEKEEKVKEKTSVEDNEPKTKTKKKYKHKFFKKKKPNSTGQ